MLFNYIILGSAAVFFILCLTALISEKNPVKTAKKRNFLRSLTVSLREITLTWVIVISALVLFISSNLKSADLIWTLCALGIFLLGVITLNSFRLFGFSKSKKRKKKSMTVGKATFVKNTAEISEASLLTEKKPQRSE